ncbi:MAG: RluA family pseudouridine synthase [Epsilonproteobacteria bacterium]|nr:RluA family pseudouridine synthase [Campylobacterota bacterium]
MGFEPKKIKINGRLIPQLVQHLNINFKQAQKFVDRKRVYYRGEILSDKKAIINGEIEVIVFVARPSGNKPIFETKEFAVFDKPTHLAVHPKNLAPSVTLLDDVKFYLGANANLAHRIDKETSGLVLCGKTKQDEINLKKMFEDKQIQKYYIALIKGHLKDEVIINKPIITNKDMNIKVKVLIDNNGKQAITKITPLRIVGDNTLVLAQPLTGRQHQIRVHLHYIGHPIVGEPLYGVQEEIADKYLKGELSLDERMRYIGHHRLMLHAHKIEFTYKNIKYVLVSQKKIN